MTKIRFMIPPGLYDYSYGMPQLIRSMHGLSNGDKSLDKSIYTEEVIVPCEIINDESFSDSESSDSSSNDTHIPNEQFIDDCQNCDLEDLKNRYDLNLINEDDIDEAFWICVDDKDLWDVGRWLYSSNKIDLHYMSDCEFVGRCRDGQLEAAQFLYSLDKYEKEAIESAFCDSPQEE